MLGSVMLGSGAGVMLGRPPPQGQNKPRVPVQFKGQGGP